MRNGSVQFTFCILNLDAQPSISFNVGCNLHGFFWTGPSQGNGRFYETVGVPYHQSEKDLFWDSRPARKLSVPIDKSSRVLSVGALVEARDFLSGDNSLTGDEHSEWRVSAAVLSYVSFTTSEPCGCGWVATANLPSAAEEWDILQSGVG